MHRQKKLTPQRDPLIEEVPTETVDAIRDWLRVTFSQPGDEPVWEIPTLDGFDPSKYKTNAEANVELKYFLRDQWRSSDHPSQLRIAKWIVKEWGGIPGNEDATIERHVGTATNERRRYAQSGIGSWSKILSIVDPDKFAIYDARVAASLVAIQLNAQVEKGTAFRYVSGRNVIISGRRDKRGKLITRGFVHEIPASKLVKLGWSVPRKGRNYAAYITLLRKCKEALPDRRLAEMEITLFRHAPALCNDLLPAELRRKSDPKKGSSTALPQTETREVLLRGC